MIDINVFLGYIYVARYRDMGKSTGIWGEKSGDIGKGTGIWGKKVERL